MSEKSKKLREARRHIHAAQAALSSCLQPDAPALTSLEASLRAIDAQETDDLMRLETTVSADPG